MKPCNVARVLIVHKGTRLNPIKLHSLSLLVAIAMMHCSPSSAPTGDTTLPRNGKLIEIVEPNGGEIYHIGDTMHIRWHAVDSLLASDCVVLSVSVDSGLSWGELHCDCIWQEATDEWEHFTSTVGDTSPCEWNWILRKATLPIHTCFIRCMCYGDESINDMSNSCFSIVATDAQQ